MGQNNCPGEGTLDGAEVEFSLGAEVGVLEEICLRGVEENVARAEQTTNDCV
jgi:hypothetical protein